MKYLSQRQQKDNNKLIIKICNWNKLEHKVKTWRCCAFSLTPFQSSLQSMNLCQMIAYWWIMFIVWCLYCSMLKIVIRVHILSPPYVRMSSWKWYSADISKHSQCILSLKIYQYVHFTSNGTVICCFLNILLLYLQTAVSVVQYQFQCQQVYL